MENAKHDRECNDCDLETTERLNYFTGQFLTERDFRAEQEYQIGKHRQHNRYLHGYGTVCGLKIVQHPNPDCQDRFVILEPGLALDCCGREIVVKEKVYIDLVKLFAAQNIDLNSISPEERNHLLFSLCYEECKTEFVPALYSECGCDEFGCDANRIVEGFGINLQLLKDLPKPLHQEPDGVSLEWKNTINLAQAARLALDSVGKKLYVLNAANPSQIMVYDTNNYALLRSIDVGATGIDLAVSPDGKYLYIIRDKTSTEGNNYFFQVFNVENSSTPPPIVNIFPLGNTPLDPNHLPQLLVAADGKVYTLDPKVPQVKIWKTDINTAGTTEANTRYAVITTGTEPRAIAVSPDGVWLLITEAADADKHIKAAKIATLTSPSPETNQIPISDKPLLIAVSGNSQKLYTVTAGKKLRAFSIHGSPITFTEIGTSGGIDLGAEEPIAITVSQSGKWIYLLSKDNSGTAKGNIKIIDGRKISTDPSHAISAPVAVVSDPQDMLLDFESSNLYVAGKGATTAPPYGGVSILNVKEAQCSEVIWKALDGCPECPDDNCIPLAIVADYVKNYRENPKITNDRIENRKYRPLVTSTETLKQLVMCALETGGGGTNGKDGTGIPGTKGDKGDPGEGLEVELTRIKALSWTHNTGKNPFATIFGPNQEKSQGIVIAFTNKVLVSNPSRPLDPPNQIDTDHVFQVLVEHDPKLQEMGVVCRCPIKGKIVPVEPTKFDGDRITEARKVIGPMAEAAAFIFDEKFFSFNDSGFPIFKNQNEGRRIDEIGIRLHGDFVLDNEDPRIAKAIDAEFTRAELPTGDRARGSKVGIQGGVFESWFWIGERPNLG
jgi:DNA-binding beta-propeller fold protein YncE